MLADPAPHAGAPAVLQLLGRAYCHLCTDMAAALAVRLAGLPVEVEWVDLDDHEELEPVYGEHIPVLLDHGRELCRHRLDPAALDAFIARIG